MSIEGGVLVATAALAVGIIAYLVRIATNYGGLLSRMLLLENFKKKIEQDNYLTHVEHHNLQEECRVSIYREINAVRSEMSKLDSILEKGEDRRREERKEDETRWRKMEDSIMEITTLLKVSILPNIEKSNKSRGGRSEAC